MKSFFRQGGVRNLSVSASHVFIEVSGKIIMIIYQRHGCWIDGNKIAYKPFWCGKFSRSQTQNIFKGKIKSCFR